MKKIKKLIFTLACLLTVTTGYADTYKVVKLSQTGLGGVALKTSTDADITVNTTSIPATDVVKIVITANQNYYLDKIVIWNVTDLRKAETRTAGPTIGSKRELGRNNSYSDHFGGTYTFEMPNNDVEIEVSFLSCTHINTTNISLGDNETSKVYKGSNYSLVVKDGSATKVLGQDYNATQSAFKDAGSYTPTITGWGTYYGTTTPTLTITKAPLTITANSYTIIYGDPIPELTVYYSGFVGGENNTSLTSQPTINNGGAVQYCHVSGSPYTLTPSGATSNNYSLSYVNGTVTVNPKALSQTTTGVAVTLECDSYDYDNNSKTPSVTSISYGSAPVLRSGTDYNVSYTSNGVHTGGNGHINPDIYYVDIAFSGDYSGSYKQPYQIRKRITLNKEWTTYCERDVEMETMPADAADTDGFKAYTVSSFSNNSITLTEQNYIKKNVPMILYRQYTGTVFYPPLVESVGSLSGTNLLLAESSDKTIAELKGSGDYSIWILVDGTFVRSDVGTLAANKCYLKIANSSVSSSRLVFGDINTGVESVVKEILNDSHWYTLDGRRLQGPPSRKGIYIVNGKKVVIK